MMSEINPKKEIMRGYEYFGIIDNCKIVDNERLWVFVALKGEDGRKRLYTVYMDTREDSEFMNFCETMNIIDDEGEIHLEWLEEFDCPVWADFKKMPDGNMLIKSMHWDEETFEERRRENEND